VLAELGDTSGARREFETALMLDPENESVKFNLGKLGGQNE
jgi:Flp pilus assembly protein TadD